MTKSLGKTHPTPQQTATDSTVQTTPSHFDQSLFQALIDSLPLAVFCKDYTANDNRGRLVLWNQMAQDLWGLAAKDVLGRSDFDFFPEEQALFFQKKDLETLHTGKLVLIPEESVTTVHGTRTVRTWKVPLINQEGPTRRILIGISQDITQIKALELELEQERAKVITNAKLAAVGEVAGGVAHEINNPLAIILGHLEKLQQLIKRSEMDGAVFLRSIEKMIQTTGRISNIVRGLKTFARDDTHEPFEAFTLEQVISLTLDLCSERLRKEDIEIQLEIHDPSLKLSGNCTQVSQVLLNLINNARDAISKLPKKWFKIQTRIRDTNVEIIVTDCGNGISKEAQTKLFQPFFTTKPPGAGTGLGLSISKGLMSKHKGNLEYDSTQPHTTFLMTLPLDLTKESDKAA